MPVIPFCSCFFSFKLFNKRNFLGFSVLNSTLWLKVLARGSCFCHSFCHYCSRVKQNQLLVWLIFWSLTIFVNILEFDNICQYSCFEPVLSHGVEWRSNSGQIGGNQDKCFYVKRMLHCSQIWCVSQLNFKQNLYFA